MSTQSDDQSNQPSRSDENDLPHYGDLIAVLDRIATALERSAVAAESQVEQNEAVSGTMASMGMLMNGPK